MISRRTFLRIFSLTSISAIIYPSSAAVGRETEKAGVASSNAPSFDYYVSSSGEALPVELVEWKAKRADGGAVLTWRTASEHNNSGFDIQHEAPEKEEWRTLGYVKGAGTTANPNDYRYTVEELVPGAHRFRLKQIDMDGTVEHSDPVTVHRGMRTAVRLTSPVPNPVRRRARLSFSVREQQSVAIRVYDVLGRQIETLYRGEPQAEKNQTIRFDATDIASGTYFIRLVAEDQVETRRCVVTK